MQAGANAHLHSRRSETALTEGVRSGNVEVVAALLDYGVDVNDTSLGGDTALVLAAEAGDLPMVNLLLSRDVAVNAKMATLLSRYGAHPTVI
ncbi:ankyrin repeat domain-containing protein [Paraburkholderia graminis]|uniref:ankyrin repeat domain-containing protein n=1 Tax=Paraburkholderia graminis TaxID=60548 RepID=UPI00286CC9B7|nr:ankyrin repeat domain-containing protein [Paraburkholderia graminis]